MNSQIKYKRIATVSTLFLALLVITSIFVPPISSWNGIPAGNPLHSDNNGSLHSHNYPASFYISVPYAPGTLSKNLSSAYNGKMSVMVTFKLSNQSQLNSFLSNLSNPSSPQYHKYMSRSEFASRFSPSISVYEDSVNYFNSFHNTSVTTYQDRVSIVIHAPAVVIDKIFNTTIKTSANSPSVYYASSSPHLPSSIGNYVSQVSGLSNQKIKLAGNLVRGTPVSSDIGIAATQSGYPAPVENNGAQLIYGSDLQVAYNEQSLLNVTYPTHEVIATILWSGQNSSGTPVGPFYPADINAYFNATLPSYEPHAKVYGVPINGAPKPGISSTYDVTGASGENTLDLEMVGSTAPSSSIYNVYGPNATYMSLNAAFAFILNPNASTPQLNNVSVISNSWGGAESNNTVWYSYLQEAQARGITVLASSGDSGDNPLSSKYSSNPNYSGDNVQFPSAMAYNNFGITAVGGTTLTLNSALHILNQTAWYESNQSTGGSPAGSTGGISSVFPEPSWQKNTEANSVIKGQGRGVPDISAIANNTIIYETVNGNLSVFPIGGTSVASPVEAGIVAEMDAILNHYNQSNLGYLNPMIYKIANRQISPLVYTSTSGYSLTGKYNSSLPMTAFYDVKYGRNHVYNASFGYDLVTGWGSIDAYNLTMYLLSVNYSGTNFALNGVENTFNLSDLNVTSYLYNGSTNSYSTVNTLFNASIQQNMFVADALGAPIYWIQNVIYINGSQQTGWTMNYTGWVVYPFYGIYPSQVVYEYSYPLGKIIHLPHEFKIKTWLSNLNVLNGQTMNFEVNSHALHIPVPGASFIIGSHNYTYFWQGKYYYNGPYPNNKYLGGLDPQFGLVGGPSAGLGNFMFPTSGNLTAYIEPMGTTTYIPASTATYNSNYSVDETGELSYNLHWAKTSSGSWGLSIQNGSQTQGVMSYFPQTYKVSFDENGLPSGTKWWVNLSNGLSLNSTSSSINFNLPNGTYSYGIATTLKTYEAFGGSIPVNGQITSASIGFRKVTYNTAFTETGLQSGTQWYVNITGMPSSGPITGSSYFADLTNGTYSYRISVPLHYVVYPSSGSVNVNGKGASVSVKFSRYAHLNVTVSPSSAIASINGINETANNGSFSIYLNQGYYYINVTTSGYKPYTDYVYLSYNSNYSYNITLQKINNAGYLAGTISPGNATIVANGMAIPVSNGYFNVSLSPGTYYVSFTANGYNSMVKEINITAGKTSTLDVSLSPVSNSVTLSGYLSPENASLVVNGFVAYVNSSGYYHISLSAGTYTISVYENGYFPYSENVTLSSSRVMNFTLVKEPKATSTTSSNDTIATGYNVTVSNITTGNGIISLSFNSSANGTLIVQIPYTDMKNATISEILNSTVYINGVPYKNYTVSISSNYTIILKVFGLKSGDPTLYWKYSPNAVIPSPTPPTTVSPTPSLAGYEVLGAIIAIGIVAGAVVITVGRRRR